MDKHLPQFVQCKDCLLLFVAVSDGERKLPFQGEVNQANTQQLMPPSPKKVVCTVYLATKHNIVST